MKKIDYRFYRTKEKEMVYGFDNCSTTYVLSMWEKEMHVSEPMQFIGIRDKNGHKIYEKDIIEYTSPYSNGRKSLLIVEYSYEDAAFLIGSIKTQFVARYGQVVGNVYENTDLLGR